LFLRMLKKSFTRGFKGKILAIVTIAFGASLATAMLNISLDIGDKVNRELKTYGANLLVVPKMDTIPVEIEGVDFNPLADRQYLNEGDLPQIKTIFWSNNIIGFAPYLEANAEVSGRSKVKILGTWFDHDLDLPTGERFTTGVKTLKPWWEVRGKWPEEGNREPGALVGAELAGELRIQTGDSLQLTVDSGGEKRPLQVKISGIVNTGGPEDEKVLVPLNLLQKTMGLEGKVAKLEVSALTTPENELARKAAADPKALSAKEFETWYCTAYVSAIAYQLEEALPGAEAKAIRQVAQSEGLILKKIQLLMFLLSGAALVSSGLGISSLMTTKVLERSKEIGLLKALGATNGGMVLLFLTEAAVNGLLGGGLGYGLGLGFAQVISTNVFNTVLTVKGLVVPLVLLLSVAVALAGSFSAMRTVIRLEPAHVLHGR